MPQHRVPHNTTAQHAVAYHSCTQSRAHCCALLCGCAVLCCAVVEVVGFRSERAVPCRAVSCASLAVWSFLTLLSPLPLPCACRGIFCLVVLGWDVSCHVMCHVMSCVMSCHVMSCHVIMSCHVMCHVTVSTLSSRGPQGFSKPRRRRSKKSFNGTLSRFLKSVCQSV